MNNKLGFICFVVIFYVVVNFSNLILDLLTIFNFMKTYFQKDEKEILTKTRMDYFNGAWLVTINYKDCYIHVHFLL